MTATMTGAGTPVPGWPTCDVDGCIGVRTASHARCLAHLDQQDREAYLAGLRPGAELDARGVRFTFQILGAVLSALQTDGVVTVGRSGSTVPDSRTTPISAGLGFRAGLSSMTRSSRRPRLFNDAAFTDEVWFDGAHFAG
jgi:hypothetical protein